MLPSQPFHIITGAPFCAAGILGSSMSTISISTHYYLHIVIYPTLRIYKLIFFDTRETCSMLHALVTINEESLVPQFLTLKLLFISFIGMSYRYLHQYKHNISRYLLEYQHGVGCRTHGPGLRRTSTAPPPEPELRSSRHRSHFYWQLPSESDIKLEW